MKIKLIFVFILLFSVSNLVYAESSTGCGMGWKVFKQMTTWAASSRSVTNATFSNTLAMTTGTSGCTRHQLVLKNKMDVHFIEANYDKVLADMSMGKGVYLNALARTLGCSDSSASDFARATLENFSEIVGNGDFINSLQKIKDVINQDSTLSAECNPVS